MNPIVLLKDLSILKGNRTVLDVGTKDGAIAKRFADLGVDVDTIDIHPLPEPIEGVNFEQIGVDEFLEKNDKHYDIVVCRHVLHLLPNPKEVIEKLNEIAGIFFFTCFGPQDDWADRVSILEHDEVLEMFPKETVRHRSEAFQYGTTYAGDTKFWHINTFVIKNTQ